MHPRLNVVTLAVRDLKTSLDFYRDGLGLPGKIIGTEYMDSVSGASGAVAFFELQGGLILALYPRSDLIKDAKVPDAGGPSQVEFSLGYLTKSRREVDAIVRQATTAGARVTEAPRERAWGIYSGYFSDPDGHLWEIIYNPQCPVEMSARSRLRKPLAGERRAGTLFFDGDAKVAQ
jgi:catechol 2,3-dioxygenase-like lactoylglutathione lyase family enzyme